MASPNCAGSPTILAVEVAKGVKYCSASQIDKYKIELGPSIRRGIPPAEIFDSQTLYNRKVAPERYVAGSISTPNDWTKCRSIWVMICANDSQPTFYSHIGKLGRFHHSSFKSGGAPSGRLRTVEILPPDIDPTMIGETGNPGLDSIRDLHALSRRPRRARSVPQERPTLCCTSDRNWR